MLLRTQLLAVLAVSSVTQAGWFGKRVDDIFGRQLLDNLGDVLDPDASPSPSGNGDSQASSGASVSPTEGSLSAPSLISTPPTTSPSTTPETPPSTTPSFSPTSTPGSSSSRQSSSSSFSTDSSQSSRSQTFSDASNTPEPTPSPSVDVFTTVVTKDGSTITSKSSSTSVPTPTPSPGSLSSETTSAGGMSPKTKTTVIGVVVGIGGAIVLGALAIVAWRIWGRKKNSEEHDDLMGDFSEHRGGSAGHEKSINTPALSPSNPFQATLEGYHQPSKVNAAANF